uniref:C-type lectin domain-containing protein n=1 Tax=Oreochromis niloticus TaxID=8128 RepID=A0A669E6X0_ORENI
MMKALTVPLLVCTMMALSQVSSVPATVPDYSSIPLTDPSPVPEDPFGGWVPSCPDGWSMHSQQCLLFVPTYMTWAEAQRNCQSRGGQLASVYSANQAEEIQKEVQRAGHGYGQFWVGGHNTAANPSWSWSDYMVRGPSGASVRQPRLCQCAPGWLWLLCSLPSPVCECV